MALTLNNATVPLVQVRTPLPTTDAGKIQVAQSATLQAISVPEAIKPAAFIGASVLALADTFLESFGILDENDMERFINNNLPRFGEFIRRNQGAIQATAGIGGAFIPGTLAVKAVRTTGFLGKLAVKTFGKGAEKFFSTGLSNRTLFEQNFQMARELVAVKGVNNLMLDPAFKAARRSAIGRSVLDTAIENLAADVAIFGTMRENEFLFPEEFTLMDNAKILLGFNALFSGGAFIIARNQFRAGLRRVLEHGESFKARNPKGRGVLDAVTGIRGERGVGISILSQWLSDVQVRLADAISTADTRAIEAAQRDSTAIEAELRRATDHVFKDSVYPGITTSYTPVENDPHIRTMLRAYRNDPQFAPGLISLEPFTPEQAANYHANIERNLESLNRRIEAQQKTLKILTAAPQKSKKAIETIKTNQAILKTLIKERDDLESLGGFVVELDGSTTAASTRAAIFQDGDRKLTAFGDGAVAARVEETDILVNRRGQVVISPDIKKISFTITDSDEFKFRRGPVPKLVKQDVWASMTHMERTAAFDVLQNMAERLEDSIDVWKGMEFNFAAKNKPFFLELDFALDLIRRYGDKVKGKIRGAESVEQLQLASLESKFEAYQIIRRQVVKAMQAGTLDATPYTDRNNIAKVLNLPGDNSRILRLFEAHAGSVGDPDVILKLSDITGGTLDGLHTALRALDDLPDNFDMTTVPLSGTMLDLPRDSRPVFAIARNLIDRGTAQPGDLAFKAAQVREQQLEKLRKAKDASLVQAALRVFDSNPEALKSFREGLKSLVDGLKTEGFIARHFFQKPFLLRDLPGTSAIDTLTDLSDKAVEVRIKELLNAPFGNTTSTRQAIFNELLLPKNKADLDAVMILRHSLGAGWDLPSDIEKIFVPITNSTGQATGLYQVAIPMTQRNVALYSKMFPDAPPLPESGGLLPITPAKPGDELRPVTISQTALNAVIALNDLQQELLTNVNALLRAMNLKEVARKPLHLPAIDMTKEHIAFLIDRAGQVRAVIGENTLPELERRVKQEIENSGGTLTALSDATVQAYKEARAIAWFNMVDFSSPLNQTGPATGRSFASVVETGPVAFTQMLESTLRLLSDIGRETRTVMLQPEMQFLRLQKTAAQGVGISKTVPTVFDEVAKLVIGAQSIEATSAPGRLLTGAQHIYERVLQRTLDNVPRLTEPGKASQREALDRFEKLSEKFGEHAPFKSVEELLARTQLAKQPIALRRHSGFLNEFTTLVSIRLLDVGMFVTNFASLLSTLPSVVAALPRRPQESIEAWRERVSAFATITDGGNVYPSIAKALASGVHLAFTPEGRRIAEEAARRGLFDQAAAELVNVFGRTGENYYLGLARTFTDKLSILTDYSERMARKISFMVAYNIGKKGLQLSDEAAMVFAHRQANNVIADFRPSVRPDIFQGAAGMPLGLFTTYMWNFLQRNLHVIESADIRAAAVQAGLQASLFGAEALPGWEVYTNIFTSNYDGSVNIVDKLNEAFGHVGADVFLNGTVSNLPRLFGLNDGISISPRVAVGLPFERGFSLQDLVPGIRVMSRISSTIGKIIDDTIEDGKFDPVQAAEFIATANINKGISNFIELAVTGRSLDNMGNIIESDTRTAAGIFSRLIGFKPLFADELRAENVRNRTTDRIQQELKERLAASLKNKLRRGKLSDEDVENALISYARAGGNAENFRDFFRSQLLRAQTSKLDLELADALRRSVDENRVGRLLYLDRD